jgi:hypothetical protein
MRCNTSTSVMRFLNNNKHSRYDMGVDLHTISLEVCNTHFSNFIDDSICDLAFYEENENETTGLSVLVSIIISTFYLQAQHKNRSCEEELPVIEIMMIALRFELVAASAHITVVVLR